MPALQRCVGDVDIFLEHHWGRAPLLRSGTGARGFDDLSSLDDLDRMIASLDLRASRLRMVRDGKTLPPSTYTTASSKRSRATENAVNPGLVYTRFSEGATIVLEGLHRYWEPLTDFCRDLEMALGQRLQVNAYITPPGSRGFDVHRDDHDVFILQVWGSKHWMVYDREDEAATLIDRDIERGDCLYIPKGFPHAARTGQHASAHLTVGILTHESIDVVREVMKLAESEPSFRERLPFGSTSDPTSLRATAERQVDELRAWLDKIDLDELTGRLARRVMSSSQPVLRGQLRQLQHLDAIDETTVVARRRGATCALLPTDTTLKVLLADRELEMPLFTQAAMEYVAVNDRFPVGDLGAHLGSQGAIVLVRRLVREGLLEAVVVD